MRPLLVPIMVALATSNAAQASNTEKPGEERATHAGREPAVQAPTRIVPNPRPATAGTPPNNTRPMSSPAAGSMNMPPLKPSLGQPPHSGPLPGQVSTGLLTVTGIGATTKRLPETVATSALVATGIGAISVALPQMVTTGPLMATGAAQ